MTGAGQLEWLLQGKEKSILEDSEAAGDDDNNGQYMYICTLALAATSASMLVELCHESQPSLSDHDTQIAAHQVSQTAGHIRLFIILLLGDYAAAVVCWFVCMDHRQCLE